MRASPDIDSLPCVQLVCLEHTNELRASLAIHGNTSDPDIQSIESSIAIDGPTASGKTVIGRSLARRLNIPFCDTGLMYRAATHAVLRSDVDIQDSAGVVALLQVTKLDLRWTDPAIPEVLLNDIPIDEELREPLVEQQVSAVAKLPDVRSLLVQRQRHFASRAPIIMVGRDIGKVVLTEARTKLFLDASLEVRSARRHADQVRAGRDFSLGQVTEATHRRDSADDTGNRSIRPEQAAEDALLIITDSLTEEQVTDQCLDHYYSMRP